MKKRILSLLVALLSMLMLASCGQNIANEASEKGKSYFDSGDYETAAKAFGVAIDNGSKDEETALLYHICLSYYQANKAFEEKDLEAALEIINGIDEEYERYGIKESILTLRSKIEKTLEAKALAADATAKVTAGDFAGATMVIEKIDISLLDEAEASLINSHKTKIAEAQAAKKPATTPAGTDKKPQSQSAPVKKPAASKPAINVNVGNSEYIFPSDNTLLTAAQLRTLSKSDIALLRNEIYARRGHIFTTEKYISYFSQKSWYAPKKDVRWADLSTIERKNIMLIKDYEQGKIK